MFVRANQQQFRNAGADVQLFYSDGTWNKPPGVSQMYMMLIGGGGNNSVGTGGGSGAVTTWWGSARNVPDSLFIDVSSGNASDTTVNYRGSGGLVALLTAAGATTTTGGAAMTANQFAASGFFQSVAGQNGSGTSVSASATTFLSGAGGSGAGNNVTANYGYTNTVTDGGYFLIQPIIVGVGGSRNNIGCGNRGGSGASGGPGLVIIASW